MKNIIIFIVCFLAVYLVFDHVFPYDNTDDKATGKRSGLVLHTDHGTGCQYLATWGLFKGSITPRLNSDGEIVCQ